MAFDFSRFVPAAAAAVLIAAAAAAQPAALTVRNGDRTVALTMAELAAMPAARLQAEPPRGEYRGVPLVDVLAKAGVTFGQTMRGPRLATYLVATGSDGYRVVIALPELDPDFTRYPGALVAFEQDGAPLSSREGPLQLVLPGDKRHARWVRNLVALEIATAPGGR